VRDYDAGVMLLQLVRHRGSRDGLVDHIVRINGRCVSLDRSWVAQERGPHDDANDGEERHRNPFFS